MRGFKHTEQLFFSAIDKNGVTVTFEALEEALEEVSVTVLDNNEVEVAVEAMDLAEEATSATFVFVEEYEDDLEGVWTVNGVSYDFDEVAAVAKVNEATNLVELWDALQSDYFEGAVEENIEAYRDAINDEETVLVKAEDVNKMIADVNKALADAETIVKPIVDAKNELELLRALQNGGFADVDSKLSSEYFTAIDGTVDKDFTVEEIQDIIDGVNNQAAADAVVELIDALPAANEIELDDKDDVVAAREAYDALTEEQQKLVSEEKVATLEAAEDAIETAEDAAALQALVEKAEEAIEALPAEIKLEHKSKVENARALVDAALELDDAATIDNIDILEAAEVTIEVIEFKADYEDVLAISLVPEDEDQVVFEDLPAIEEALEAYGELSSEAKALLKEEKSKLDQLEVSAKDRYRIDINLINGAGNMSEKLELLNNRFYNRLSDVQKEEVAMLLIDKRNKMTDKKFENFDSIETNLNLTIVDYKGYISGINAAETLEKMKEELGNIPVITETGAELTLLADLVLEARPEAGYATFAEILAAIE